MRERVAIVFLTLSTAATLGLGGAVAYAFTHRGTATAQAGGVKGQTYATTNPSAPAGGSKSSSGGRSGGPSSGGGSHSATGKPSSTSSPASRKLGACARTPQPLPMIPIFAGIAFELN